MQGRVNRKLCHFMNKHRRADTVAVMPHKYILYLPEIVLKVSHWWNYTINYRGNFCWWKQCCFWSVYKGCRLHYSWRPTKPKNEIVGPHCSVTKHCMNQPFVNTNAWTDTSFHFFFLVSGDVHLKLLTFTVPCKNTQWLIWNWALSPRI